MTSPTRSRTLSRSGLLGWLVAIVCVVVAAAGLQVSEPEKSVQTTTGLRDQRLAFEDGSVTVGASRS